MPPATLDNVFLAGWHTSNGVRFYTKNRYTGHMIEFSQTTQHLMLPGPTGQLELITTWPKEQCRGVAIMCHPDPRQEGTMHNKVVTTTTRAFEHLQLATVRFNYRGIGKSEGHYGDVTGEQDDLRAIIDWVKQQLPEQPLWLGGFSFGSIIAAGVANGRHDTTQLLTIAPPIERYPYQSLTDIHCPWLVIQGDKDEVAPPEPVIEFAKQPPSPLELTVMPDVGHFFHGKLIELREMIKAHYG